MWEQDRAAADRRRNFSSLMPAIRLSELRRPQGESTAAAEHRPFQILPRIKFSEWMVKEWKGERQAMTFPPRLAGIFPGEAPSLAAGKTPLYAAP